MSKFLLFVLMISLNLAYAQNKTCTYSIFGTSTDVHSGKPLPYATVWLDSLNISAVTNEKGQYKFENICLGSYIIKSSYIGFNNFELKVKVIKDTEINIQLHPEACELSEITVIGHSEGVNNRIVNSLKNEDLLQNRGKNMGEALKEINGVNSLQTGNSISKPMIHGMHSNRIEIVNNGVLLESQQWGQEHAPEIDLNQNDEIQVVKGAESIRYGAGAIGGVIVVKQSEITDSLIHGGLLLSGANNGQMYSSTLRFEGKPFKSNPLKWRLSGTFKQAGNMKTANYFMKNTGFTERNFSVLLDYHKDKYGVNFQQTQFNSTVGIFSGSHIGNLTDLKDALKSDEPQSVYTGTFSYSIERPNQEVFHDIQKLSSYYKLNSNSIFEFNLSRQYNLRQEYDNHSIENVPSVQFELTTYQTELLFKHKLTRFSNGKIGVQLLNQKNTYEGRYFIPNYLMNNIGLFAIEKYTLNRLEIEAGIRYDYRNLDSYMYELNEVVLKHKEFENLTFSIGSKYEFNKDLHVNLLLASAWRPPTVNELYSNGVHHGAASYEFGNESITKEQSYQSLLTLHYDAHEKHKFEITGFYNYFNNFIYLQPTSNLVLTIRGAFPEYRILQKDVIYKGLDFNYFYTFLPHLTYNVKYAMIRANTVSGDYLSLIPPDQLNQKIRYHTKEIWKFSHLYFAINLQLTAEQTKYEKSVEDFPPKPPKGYKLVNFEGGFETKINRMPCSFAFGVSNLLNESYRNYLNRFYYFAHEQGRNFYLNINILFNNEKQN